MHPWQHQVFGTVVRGELNVITAGRGAGKSTFAQKYLNDYQKYLDQFAWCTEKFGKTSKERWWYIDGEFKFVDSRDEMLFVLWWG